jgi:anti-sigma B factor antagonist
VGPGRIEEVRVDRGVIVEVHGEHDLHTAPALRERLDAAIDAGSAIVVDLGPASFIDSSVIRVILETRGRALESGGGFAVAMAGEGEPPVRRVLEVTGLIEQLPVIDDRDAAMDAAASRAGP